MKKEEQKRLGISDKTLKEIKEFFWKTSMPRIIDQRREEGTLHEILKE